MEVFLSLTSSAVNLLVPATLAAICAAAVSFLIASAWQCTLKLVHANETKAATVHSIRCSARLMHAAFPAAMRGLLHNAAFAAGKHPLCNSLVFWASHSFVVCKPQLVHPVTVSASLVSNSHKTCCTRSMFSAYHWLLTIKCCVIQH